MGQLSRLISMAALRAAWARVQARNAGPGIDGVTVAEYAVNVSERLATLAVALEVDQWRPKPGRKLRLADDPERPIVVACVEDRVVQRALADVLSPHFERRLTSAARAYRPGVALDTTLHWVSRHLSEGRQFFVRTDIRKFFDEIDRSRLIARLEAHDVEAALVRMVERLLRAGALEGSVVQDSGAGVGQGSALSPLLSNVYLTHVDEAVLDAGFSYVRYADDILVLTTTDTRAEDALALLSLHLEEAGLALNLRKTRRGHLRDGFGFLGAYFDSTGRTVSATMMDSVAQRAEGAARGPMPAQALADTVDELTRWYGELPVERMSSLALVAGWVLRGPEDALDESRAVRAARRRLALPANAALNPEVHVALAERWGALARALPTSGEVRRALLVDAQAAVAASLSEVLSHRLAEVMEVPTSALRVLTLGWPEASAALDQLGRRSLAWAARQLAEPSPEVGPAPAPEVPPHEAPDEVLSAILELWRGREGCHVIEVAADDGHVTLVTQRGDVTLEALRRHLAGAQRVGVHVVRTDETVLLACIESHARRDAVVVAAGSGPASASPHETLNLLMHRVHDDAVAVGRAARRFGAVMALETCDRFVRRQWLLFQRPTPLRQARALLRLIDEAAGQPAPGVVRTATPATDRVRGGAGPALLLPLGAAPRSGFRAHMARVTGQASPQAVNVLRSMARMTPADVIQATCRLGPGEAAPNDALAVLPIARRVLGGCAMLRALSRKSERLGVLESDERATLVEALGHLPPDEAFPALQAILPGEAGETRALRRRLAKLPDAPLSCARVRARHPNISVEVGCDCRFAALGAARYPTPLLHGMPGHEIAAFMRGAPRRVEREPPPEAVVDPQIVAAARVLMRRASHLKDAQRTHAEAEREVARLLKSHGLDAVTVDGVVVRPGLKG